MKPIANPSVGLAADLAAYWVFEAEIGFCDKMARFFCALVLGIFAIFLAKHSGFGRSLEEPKDRKAQNPLIFLRNQPVNRVNDFNVKITVISLNAPYFCKCL